MLTNQPSLTYDFGQIDPKNTNTWNSNYFLVFIFFEILGYFAEIYMMALIPSLNNKKHFCPPPQRGTGDYVFSGVRTSRTSRTYVRPISCSRDIS